MATVYCKTRYCKTTGRTEDNFFLATSRNSYYLFSQPHKKGVHSYYAGGVNLNNAMDFSKGRSDFGILNTMEKLPKYIRYIEKEYGEEIMRKTKNRKEGCVTAWR